MELQRAIQIFLALSQETRLQIFKILIEYGSEGVSAGKIGERLGVLHNTLSFHLSHLVETNLVSSRKNGRLVIYAAKCETIDEVIAYLKQNCCTKEVSSSKTTKDKGILCS
jgi:DNA-binding transcriptional ArsR family regulator